jgi:hypothetical protein
MFYFLHVHYDVQYIVLLHVHSESSGNNQISTDMAHSNLESWIFLATLLEGLRF